VSRGGKGGGNVPEPSGAVGEDRHAPGPTAAIVVIGDEVLSGRVEDINSLYLSRGLLELGVAVRRIVVVADVVADIAAEVRACADRFTHVFTTGGVGPTHDDVSLKGVAAAFGCRQVRSPQAERIIRDFYGAAMNDSALRMADIPQGAELVMPEGMRFPVVRVENVWVFPGSPHLLRAKFDALRDRFASTPFSNAQLAVNCGEPEIAAFLEQVQGEFPRVAIGSYPQEPGAPVRLILTLRGKDGGMVARVLEQLRSGLSGHLVE